MLAPPLAEERIVSGGVFLGARVGRVQASFEWPAISMFGGRVKYGALTAKLVLLWNLALVALRVP